VANRWTGATGFLDLPVSGRVDDGATLVGEGAGSRNFVGRHGLAQVWNRAGWVNREGPRTLMLASCVAARNRAWADCDRPAAIQRSEARS